MIVGFPSAKTGHFPGIARPVKSAWYVVGPVTFPVGCGPSCFLCMYFTGIFHCTKSLRYVLVPSNLAPVEPKLHPCLMTTFLGCGPLLQKSTLYVVVPANLPPPLWFWCSIFRRGAMDFDLSQKSTL